MVQNCDFAFGAIWKIFIVFWKNFISFFLFKILLSTRVQKPVNFLCRIWWQVYERKCFYFSKEPISIIKENVTNEIFVCISAKFIFGLAYFLDFFFFILNKSLFIHLFTFIIDFEACFFEFALIFSSKIPIFYVQVSPA